jgi:hypothetical protein
MAFAFGTAARVWLDGKQAACAINEINMEVELDEAETTTLCSTIKDYIPGLSEVTVEMEGYYDTNTASPATTLEAWMDGRIGTTFPMTYAPEGGGDIGDPVYIMNGFLQEYSIENTVDEAAAMEMTFRATSGLSRAKVLHTSGTARTATGNGGDTPPGTGNVDNTTSTAFGGVGVLQVDTVSGTTPALVAKIQHSSDGTTWVDLITFSSQNAVNGEYATVSGTVNRYLRALWTISGTTPSFNFNIAFARNTV